MHWTGSAGTILSVEVTDCKDLPCVVYRPGNYSINITFVAREWRVVCGRCVVYRPGNYSINITFVAPDWRVVCGRCVVYKPGNYSISITQRKQHEHYYSLYWGQQPM